MKRYTLTLTDKCNKNCSYCYENGVRQNISLSNSMFLKQVNRIVSYDTNEPKSVSFFGGEPFMELGLMHKAVDMFKIYNTANPNNPISVSFITNGILLDSKDTMNLLQECKDSNLKPHIIVSYDGVQNKIKNLEDNIKELVNILSDDSVRINYTISKYNIENIVDNYKLAETLNVKKVHYRPVHEDFVLDATLTHTYRDNITMLFDYLVTANRPREIFPYIMRNSMWNMTKEEVYNYLYTPYTHVGCNIGLNNVTYSMDDTSYYCHRLQFYQSFISDVKDANNHMIQNNGMFHYEDCNTCSTLKHCGLCSVLNEIYTGDRNTPHPLLCKFYKTVFALTKKFFKMMHPNYVDEDYTNVI